MAYDDATRVDTATSRMTTTGSVKTNVRSDAKTFGENMITRITTAGGGDQEKQDFRDALIDILRDWDYRLQ